MASKRWFQHVTERSNALDLESGVFTWTDPRKIARSLKRSAERSTRRKAEPYRSAMSMLAFYINRAGKGLSQPQRRRLDAAKDEFAKALQAAGTSAREGVVMSRPREGIEPLFPGPQSRKRITR